jgi:hypothetical protein
MQSWYEDVELKDIPYTPASMPAKISYKTDVPKREFIEHIVGEHILPETGIAFDQINYIRAGESHPSLPEKYETTDDYLQGFQAVSKPGTPFFSMIDDYHANLIYVRFRKSDGQYVVATIVINRWHDNVTFLFGEKGTLDQTRDNADFIMGFMGSYPNYFLDIRQEDLPDFFDLLANFNGSPEHLERFDRYGINRADDDFWVMYDWFQERFNEEGPVRSGLFDLNRYFYKAR